MNAPELPGAAPLIVPVLMELPQITVAPLPTLRQPSANNGARRMKINGAQNGVIDILIR